MISNTKNMIYLLVNSLVDPENKNFRVETHLPSPMTARVELLICWRVYIALIIYTLL